MISSDSEDKVAILENLVEDKLDILVGTQIIAKGYNFPNLCLVGVIQADQGLSSGDFRNTENIYQLLTQVKGRCGRFDLDGDVILQTNNPESPLLRAIGENDFEKWAGAELSLRKANMLPPFYRLIRIIVASKFAIKSCSDANYLYEQLREKLSRITIYPPCPTELKKYKSTFRYVILVRYSAGSYPQKEIMEVFKQIKLPNKSKIIPDVDPYRFF
jgi:primosomal protein N' (replication factor Y)